MEAFASSEFRRRVPTADAILKGRGNVFQRLDDTADLFAAQLDVDPRDAPDLDWEVLRRLWAARHAHVHADGRVDEKYLRAVPTTPLKVGQRIVVSSRDALTAIDLAAALCDVLGDRTI